MIFQRIFTINSSLSLSVSPSVNTNVHLQVPLLAYIKMHKHIHTYKMACIVGSVSVENLITTVLLIALCDGFVSIVSELLLKESLY